MKRNCYWLLAGTALALILYISFSRKQSEIEAKVPQIHLGMSRAQVVALLGDNYWETRQEPSFTVLTWHSDTSLLSDEVLLGVVLDQKGEVAGVVVNTAEPSLLHKLQRKVGW